MSETDLDLFLAADPNRAEHYLAIQHTLMKPTHRRIAANYIEWTPSGVTSTWRDYVVGFTDDEIAAIDAAIGEA